MNDSTPSLDRPGLSHLAHQRRRELRALARRLQAAETKVTNIRAELDRRLFAWHDDGTPVSDLSLESGLSRETVYKSIARVRADFSPRSKR